MVSLAMSGSSSASTRKDRAGARAIGSALALQIGFFVAATSAWIRLDTVPPLWDSAHYLQQSVVLYRALRDDGPGDFLAAFSRAMGQKAPLIAALPIPVYATFGESHTAARSVNLAWIAIASCALYGVGRLIHGPATGLLAVTILNTFPLVAGMSRQYLVEYGLMALVILWIYCLLAWTRRPNRLYAWLMGALLGIGLLMKVTFPLYLAFPAAVVAWERRTREDGFRAVVRTALTALLVAVPIASLWYARNLGSVLRYALSGGFGELGRPYGTGSVFSFSAVGEYWLRLFNSGISAAYSILFLTALAFWMGRRLWKRAPSPGDRRAIGKAILLAWWAPPLAILTFAVNKDPRYAVPLLPAVALSIALWASELSTRRRYLAYALVTLFGVSNYLFYSFDSRWNRLELRTGRLVLLAGELDWARPPVSEIWPAEAIVAAIADDAMRQNSPRPRARVLFSHPRLNAHALNYFATLEAKAPRFATIPFTNSTRLGELISEVRTGFEYLVAKSSDLGPPMLNTRNTEVAAALSRGDLDYEAIAQFDLPDGSRAIVYRRSPLSLPTPDAAANG